MKNKSVMATTPEGPVYSNPSSKPKPAKKRQPASEQTALSSSNNEYKIRRATKLYKDLHRYEAHNNRLHTANERLVYAKHSNAHSIKGIEYAKSIGQV